MHVNFIGNCFALRVWAFKIYMDYWCNSSIIWRELIVHVIYRSVWMSTEHQTSFMFVHGGKVASFTRCEMLHMNTIFSTVSHTSLGEPFLKCRYEHRVSYCKWNLFRPMCYHPRTSAWHRVSNSSSIISMSKDTIKRYRNIAGMSMSLFLIMFLGKTAPSNHLMAAKTILNNLLCCMRTRVDLNLLQGALHLAIIRYEDPYYLLDDKHYLLLPGNCKLWWHMLLQKEETWNFSLKAYLLNYGSGILEVQHLVRANSMGKYNILIRCCEKGKSSQNLLHVVGSLNCFKYEKSFQRISKLLNNEDQFEFIR